MSDKTTDAEPVEEVAEATVIAEPAVPEDGPAPTKSGSRRLIGAFLGLALIGGAGFGLAWYDPLKLRGDDPVPALETRLATAEARLAETSIELTALQEKYEQADSQIGAQAAEIGKLAEVAVRLDSVEAGIEALSNAPANADGSIPAGAFAALSAEVESLRADIAALKAAPSPGSEAAIADAVDKAMADWADQQAAKAEAEVAASKTRLARLEALEAIRRAAASGAPFADALPALDGLPIDPVLASAAGTGLTTLASLTDAFPEVARSALEASLRAEGGSVDTTSGFWNFLRVQTGARSLEPREGNDPDAVLSRAEAAVKAGQVSAALDELSALPEAGRLAMAGWMDEARQFLAAEKAIAGLEAAIEG